MAGGITIVVPGVPIPKGRPRFARAGKFVRTFTPKKTGDYESHVKSHAAEEMMRLHMPLFTGALTVSIIASLPIPASWSQKKRREAAAGRMSHVSKPDPDNLAKSLLDALQGVVFRDDSQIVDLRIRKVYGDPRVAISIDRAIAEAA